MTGASNTIDLRLSDGAVAELAGPFSSGVCVACERPDDCLVCLTVRRSPNADELPPEPLMLMFCAPCVVGALGIRLAAAASAREDGAIDLTWMREVGTPSVRGIRNISRPVGKSRSTNNQETP